MNTNNFKEFLNKYEFTYEITTNNAPYLILTILSILFHIWVFPITLFILNMLSSFSIWFAIYVVFNANKERVEEKIIKDNKIYILTLLANITQLFYFNNYFIIVSISSYILLMSILILFLTIYSSLYKEN